MDMYRVSDMTEGENDDKSKEACMDHLIFTLLHGIAPP